MTDVGATEFTFQLRRAQHGDDGAVHDLYREYTPAVRGYLRGHGAVDPDDITSEVFVTVLRNLPTFTGSEEAFRTWIFVTAHRRLVDERRRIGRRRTDVTEPDRLHDLVKGTDHDAGDHVLDRIGNERILRLLDDLTPTQRSVVLLHTIGGLPLAQVATILDKRVGAVKSLHRRALRAVARAMERAELAGGDER